MIRNTALALAGCTALAIGAFPAAAHAAENPSALMTCESGTYTVTGFGRGEPLHVVLRVVYDDPPDEEGGGGLT